MDQDSPLNHSGVVDDVSSSSSLYSSPSENMSTDQEHFNGSRPSTRAASNTYTPSFMSQHATETAERLSTPTYILPTPFTSNGHRVQRKPVHTPTKMAPNVPYHLNTNGSPAQVTSGVLLVLVAGEVHPSTFLYLEMLLRRQHFSSIVLAAGTAQEMVLKQLKIDIYALVGRMGRELRMVVQTRDKWSESVIEDIVQEAMKGGEGIQGVICCPEFDEADVYSADILDLSEGQLQQSWKQSVAFVHASMRGAGKHILPKCHPEDGPKSGAFPRAPRGPFFLVAASASSTVSSSITKSACDTLIHRLGEATRAQGLTVAYADSILISRANSKKPGPVEEVFPQPDAYSDAQHEPIFTPNESPTKLWNMWAVQNDVGYADY